MDIITNEKIENSRDTGVDSTDFYRESIKKALYSVIGNVMEDETQRAREQIIKERENAVQQIAEETRSLFNKILDNEKKAIWADERKTILSEVINSGEVKAGITPAYTIQSSINVANGEMQNISNNLHETAFKEIVEVEILPPRDQNGIAILNTYLINMPEVIKVELVTLIDKSVFKVMLKKPVNFVEQLSSLPQVFNAEETLEKGQKKIQITLSVKAKLEQNQNEVNDKINKIFKKKN
jgi:hypothetical protein